MRPVVIRALFLPLPINPVQIGACRCPDTRSLGERGQKLLIALAAVSSDDAPQGCVRFKGRGVDADRFFFYQAGGTQALQHPGKDGAMRFERNQPPWARNRRVVRWRIGQAQAEKIAQGQRSAARHAIPRSESMPSKYPISSSRK
jgi:hypothetical protein